MLAIDRKKKILTEVGGGKNKSYSALCLFIVFSCIWVSKNWNRNITVQRQEQQQHYSVPPSNNTVNPNHWEVQGWLFFFFSFLTKKVFFPGIQLYVTFEHQNENQDWMTLLFRFKSKHTWSSQSTGGKYIWPILSLSVSKEQIEHQKEGGAFWTPVYTCFSSERTSLGKL